MPGIDKERGDSNINGPSLVRVPEWVENPLGKYYLYFAHHRGGYIRLAYADAIEGPYTVYPPGALDRDNTVFRGFHNHIASPDVHIDKWNRRFVMYFHGNYGDGQATCWATSADGLNYIASDTLDKGMGPYFRVFWWNGYPYATHSGWISRGKTPEWTTTFVRRESPLFSAQLKPPTNFTSFLRHTANFLEGDILTVYYSIIGDSPERIRKSTMQLTDDWNEWQPSEPMEVIASKHDFEGVDLPVEQSTRGLAIDRVHQLRDPAIYCEHGKTWLLYSVAGEQGIAITELANN